MKKSLTITITAIALLILLIAAYFMTMGSGALKRHITMSGVYAVCRPSGYDVVCFMDADGHDGGADCLSLKELGITQCR